MVILRFRHYLPALKVWAQQWKQNGKNKCDLLSGTSAPNPRLLTGSLTILGTSSQNQIELCSLLCGNISSGIKQCSTESYLEICHGPWKCFRHFEPGSLTTLPCKLWTCLLSRCHPWLSAGAPLPLVNWLATWVFYKACCQVSPAPKPHLRSLRACAISDSTQPLLRMSPLFNPDWFTPSGLTPFTLELLT